MNPIKKTKNIKSVNSFIKQSSSLELYQHFLDNFSASSISSQVPKNFIIKNSMLAINSLDKNSFLFAYNCKHNL